MVIFILIRVFLTVTSAVYEHRGTQVAIDHCRHQESRKRKNCANQSSSRCMRRPNSESHLHAVGQPSMPEVVESQYFFPILRHVVSVKICV